MDPVAPADGPVLVPMISRAFADDPCFRWIFRDETRRQADLEVFFQAAAAVFLPLGFSVATRDRSSTTLWAPPGRWETPDEVNVEFGPKLADQCGPAAMDRLLAFFAQTEARHPAEAHYYLAVAASEPDRCGQGLASSCIAAVLAAVDREGLPAYLESSNDRNVPLYRRHGFEVVGVEPLGGDGPPITFMWRPPAGTT